jgi:hypothetical protein
VSNLTQEALEARRAYQREWGRKNPEKRKAANARYWARRAARKAAEKQQNVEGKADGTDSNN